MALILTTPNLSLSNKKIRINMHTDLQSFIYNDGGRSNYFKGKGGDCVARAIAIVSEMDYMEVYKELSSGNATQRITSKNKNRSKSGKKTALHGINTKRKWFQDYMKQLGFIWIPCMQIGSGCKVHLNPKELPKGRLIVSVSRHYTAVIDGIINDTYDCSRNGNRCVYGYWIKK